MTSLRLTVCFKQGEIDVKAETFVEIITDGELEATKKRATVR